VHWRRAGDCYGGGELSVNLMVQIHFVILSEAKDLCIPLAPAECIGSSLRSE